MQVLMTASKKSQDGRPLFTPPPQVKISDARLAERTAESTLFGDDLQEIRTKYNSQ
jgi:hypothetical protein